jgi:hypothetical protein
MTALPAYAALAWGSETGAYLLLLDLVTVPLAHHRGVLGDLFALRGLGQSDLPTLLVVTSDGGRAAAWLAVLEEVRRRRAEAPLTACIATWDGLRAGLDILSREVRISSPQPAQLVQRVRLRPARPRRNSLYPRIHCHGSSVKACASRAHRTSRAASAGSLSTSRRPIGRCWTQRVGTRS